MPADEDGNPWEYELKFDPTRLITLPGGALGYQHQQGDVDEDGNEDPVPTLIGLLINQIGKHTRALDEARGVDPKPIPGATIYLTYTGEGEDEPATFEINIRRVDTAMVDEILNEARRTN